MKLIYLTITLFLIASSPQVVNAQTQFGDSTGHGYFYLRGNTDTYPNSQLRITKWSNSNAHIDVWDEKTLYLNFYKGAAVGFGDGAGSVTGIWKSNGDVGIGTTSPSEALDVVGKIKSDYLILNSVSSSEGGELMLAGPSGYNDWKVDNVNGKFRLHHSGTAYFNVLPDGRVGIGTASPSEPLHVVDESGAVTFGRPGTEMNNRLTLDASTGYENQIYFRSRPGRIFTSGSQNLILGNSVSANNLVVSGSTGNVDIGTTTPGNKLEVNGTIRAKEIKVEATSWPDYVFEESYTLPTLAELEAFIKANKHLPEVPSAKEAEANGIELGAMNTLLLKKIEELTLHIIELEKRVKEVDKASKNNILHYE